MLSHHRATFALVLLALVYSFPVCADETEPLQPVIVVLKFPDFVPEGKLKRAEVDDQRSRIAALQRKIKTKHFDEHARAVREFVTIPLIALEATPKLLRKLEKDDDIAAIQQDELFSAQLSTSGPLIRAPESWSLGFTGQGQMIAVLDTGVDAGHPFLQGKVVREACFSEPFSGTRTSLCPSGAPTQHGPGSAAPCAPSYSSSCDHGTHVAGIAAGNGAAAGVTYSGVAKDAQLVAAQVFHYVTSSALCNGSPSCIQAGRGDLLRALEWVHLLKRDEGLPIAAVNASLGSCCYSSRSNCDLVQDFLPVVQNLLSVGVAVVGIAGNDGLIDGRVAYPLCQTGVTLVGASTSSDAIATFSNSSAMVDFVAPGAAIQSSVPGGGYAVMSGTSMAAPHVAGAFAILRQRQPFALLTTLKNNLAAASVPVSDSRNGLVFRRIDVRAALDLADTTPPSVPANFSAHVTASHLVDLSWSSSTDNVQLQHYKVYRRTTIAGGWDAIAATTGTTFSDPLGGITCAHYRVAAVDTSGNESTSVTRAIADIAFTPLTSSTPVAASHLREIRTAVRLLQSSAGLNPTFTDADDTLAGLTIKAVHLTEARSLSRAGARRDRCSAIPSVHGSRNRAGRDTGPQAPHRRNPRAGEVMRFLVLPTVLMLLLVPAALASDLRITKSAAVDVAFGSGTRPQEVLFPGGGIIYTIAITNLGAVPATGIVVTDPLPATVAFSGTLRLGNPWTCTELPDGALGGTLTCSMPSLAPGQTAHLLIFMDVPRTHPSGTIVNTATVTATTPDPNLLNNTATAAIDVVVTVPALSPIAVTALIVLLALIALRRSM